jgi:transposase InsO family protein
MIYVDNGKVYSARTRRLACAKLGVSLIHTKPYDPEAKGKIERFFGTVRRRPWRGALAAKNPSLVFRGEGAVTARSEPFGRF